MSIYILYYLELYFDEGDRALNVDCSNLYLTKWNLGFLSWQSLSVSSSLWWSHENVPGSCRVLMFLRQPLVHTAGQVRLDGLCLRCAAVYLAAGRFPRGSTVAVLFPALRGKLPVCRGLCVPKAGGCNLVNDSPVCAHVNESTWHRRSTVGLRQMKCVLHMSDIFSSQTQLLTPSLNNSLYTNTQRRLLFWSLLWPWMSQKSGRLDQPLDTCFKISSRPGT